MLQVQLSLDVEVLELYNGYIQGTPANAAPLDLQYADYAVWQRNILQGDVLDHKLNYWKAHLDGVTPLELPTDFVRPAVWTGRGAMTRFHIDKELLDQLRSIGHVQGTTLFMTLLSGLKALLYQYTRQEDICIGSGVAGRQHQELENLIGFFVNTLALRSTVRSDMRFEELLQKVKATTLGAYENQDAPFEKVVDAVVSRRDLSRNPLFQVMFVLQNTPEVPEMKLGDVELTPENYEHSTAQFDLSFSIRETSEGLEGELEYCSDIYKSETIGRLIDHYIQVLRAVAKEPHQLVGNLSMLTEPERKQVLFDFNTRQSTYPATESIVDLFEQQVTERLSETALVFGDQQLSYKELNERSNQLAHYLKAKGVATETMVPLCIERSMDLIVGILGILKAGGVYVPLDPKYPSDRLGFMLEDTQAIIAVSTSESRSKFGAAALQIVELDTE